MVFGDGALWIWNFADEHVPDAIQIVDIWHAKQHVFDVAKALYGKGSDLAAQWGKARRDELDQGRLDLVLAALRKHASHCDEAARNIEYFQNNRARMDYPRFREQGLCVSTGVVEGGCKSLIGGRLKRGGMHWSVSGANSSSRSVARFTATASTTTGSAVLAESNPKSQNCRAPVLNLDFLTCKVL